MRSIKTLTAIQWICFMFTSGLLVYLLNPIEDEPMCNISFYEREYRSYSGNAEGWEDKISDDVEQDIKRMAENPLFQFYIPDNVIKDKPTRSTPPPIYNNPFFSAPPIIVDEPGGKVCTVDEPNTIFLILIGLFYGIFNNRNKTNRS